MKVGEKPAAKLLSEYHRIEIISGILRPTRSATGPAFLLQLLHVELEQSGEPPARVAAHEFLGT